MVSNSKLATLAAHIASAASSWQRAAQSMSPTVDGAAHKTGAVAVAVEQTRTNIETAAEAIANLPAAIADVGRLRPPSKSTQC